MLAKRVSDQEIEILKKQELELLEQKLALHEGLPHIHGWKWYHWAKEVYDSFNREIFLTAANQVSKSSTAIRRNIEWACNPDIWKKAWPGLMPGQIPNQFWYFYPSKEVATIEFETKWAPLFLPRNGYKKDKLYGWEEFYEKNYVSELKFNSGVTIYFKSYEQKAVNLQTGTVYHITLDEECPVHLLPELQARLNASDGYLLSVFTATLCQLYWEKTMEPKSKEEELHPNALKKQVSLYDSMFYTDGTPSPWTPEKIKRAEERCATPAEKLRRIHGKFVRDEGLRYHGFDRTKNVTPPHPLPKHWHVYTGTDPGSGGAKGHPSGIVFLAVSPDFKQGRVFRAWRGDKIQTSSQDTLNKYRMLRVHLKPVLQIYDPASKDFEIIATRQGETFIPAQKERDSDIGLLNVLFKNGMLKIQGEDPETEKLISELCSLGVDDKKTDRDVIDDLSDALRYVAYRVPWDFSEIGAQAEAEVLAEMPKEPEKSAQDQRREWFNSSGENDSVSDIDSELDFWNEMAGT